MTHPTPARRIVAILSLFLLATTPTFGVSITWDATTNTTWDTSTANWTGTSTTYTEGDDVLFGDTGAGTVAVDAGGVTPTSTTINSTSNYTFTGGSILGGTLTKSGTSIVTLANDANGFSDITMNSGTLRYNDPNQLGSGPISFESTSILQYTGNPAAVISGGAIDMNAGVCRIRLGGATLARDVNGNTVLARIGNGVLSGTITGFFQVESGTVKLTGTNNAINTVYLGANGQSGVLEITDRQNLSSAGSATVSLNTWGGTLRIAGEPTSNFTDSIAISGAGGTIPVIEVQDAAATVDWTGNFQFNTDGSAVVKAGPGTLNLATINSTVSTRTLAITVSDGTLNINDNDSGAGAFGNVTVQNGGTLGGTGTIDLAANSSLTVISGGTLAPGASIGTLTVDLAETDTSVILANGAILEFELGTPGIGDLLQFNNFTSGDLSLSDNVITFIDVGGLAYGTYTLMSFYSDDGVTPVDHGLTSGLLIGTGLPLGGELDFSSTLGEIRLQVVPEPSSMILIGLGGTLLMRRRQMRRG